MSDSLPGPGTGWMPPGAASPPPPPPPPPLLDPFASPAPPPRRNRAKRIGAVVGATALLAAGTFAVVTIAANDGSGGAASPQEVGERFVEALGNEDVLGLVDLLLPGERDTFREPLIELVDNLRRIELLSDEASLDGIAGVDLVFEDVEVDEEPTNVDDITNVRISGSVALTVDGDAVPIGNLLLEDVFGGDPPDLDADEPFVDFESIRVTTVERDGRWFLSLFHTAAEALRGEADVPEEGLTASGAAEPELAVDQLLDGVSDLDVEAIIASLDPSEAEALQRYAPLFLEGADDLADDAPFTWEISDVEYTVTGSGDRRSVGIDGLSFRFSDGYQEVDLRLEEGCVTGEVDSEEVELCGAGLAGLDELTADLGFDDAEPREFIEAVTDAFADYEASGIAVHEVDGEWYVSPVRTLFDGVDAVLAALDRDEIDEIAQATGPFVDWLFEYAFLYGFEDAFGS
jgi:hypothetical protein